MSTIVIAVLFSGNMMLKQFIAILKIVTTATLFPRKTVGDVVISILIVLTIAMLFPRVQLMVYEYGVPSIRNVVSVAMFISTRRVPV